MDPPVAWVRISASALSIEGENNNDCAIKGATAYYLLSPASSCKTLTHKPPNGFFHWVHVVLHCCQGWWICWGYSLWRGDKRKGQLCLLRRCLRKSLDSHFMKVYSSTFFIWHCLRILVKSGIGLISTSLCPQPQSWPVIPTVSTRHHHIPHTFHSPRSIIFQWKILLHSFP